MEKLEYHLSLTNYYPILMGSSIYSYSDTLFTEIDVARFFVLIDSSVNSIFEDYLRPFFSSSRQYCDTIVLPAGENMKTLQNITNGIESLIQLGVRRKDHLIAVGGGATTDFVGFLASIYMRGISYINIPTTLVGQVDAAIGSKTAVNFGGSKNIIGSFHHPKAVFIDENFLVKLPKKEISNGLAECIKTGIIASQELFEFIEDNVDSIFQRDPAVLKELVRTTVAAKLRLLAHDPLESTLSRSLNFGHTVGHAIELEDSLSLSHGEAISIGMLASVKVAKARGILHSNDAQRIVNLLRGCGLPENALSLHRKRFEDCIERIRMIRDGKLRFVMPVEIGEVIIVDDISSEELFNASVSSW